MALTVLLNGSAGRMGQAIIAAAPGLGIQVGAAIDLGGDVGPALAGCDVIIDFSSAAATRALLELAVARQKPIVIGTTGHSAAEKASLSKLAARVPCVWAGNYSVGVNLLFALTRRAAQILGEADVEVLEMHHRLKKDAPSGTATRLLEILMEERKATAADLRHGRQGLVGARTDSEIGIHALRGGDVVGDHTVMFATPGERLELTHRASDRGIFARGALRAALWVAQQKSGVYDMQDVLGLT
jgi:4-hydroxy-tetrahydrodipicolinate reductase